MAQGFLYSLVFHSFLILAFFSFLAGPQRLSRSYYTIDLSIGSMNLSSQGDSSSNIERLQEEEDSLKLPSLKKQKKAQPILRSNGGKTRVGSGTRIGGGGGLADAPYPFYMEAIRRKIANFWDMQYWRDHFLIREAQAVFIINKDGSISSVELSEKSGDPVFDLTCLRSIGLAAPFPPLPQGFEEEKLKIVFDFEIAYQ